MSRCRLSSRGFGTWAWRGAGAGELAGDEDGEDEADERDHEHDPQGDREGLALGELDGHQGRADPAAAPNPPAPLITPKYLAREVTSGKVTVTRM